MNHQERRQIQRAQLGNAADAMTEEIRQGKWDHLPDLKAKPIPQIREIIEEMEKRCPGYRLEDYQDSIARSLFHNR